MIVVYFLCEDCRNLKSSVFHANCFAKLISACDHSCHVQLRNLLYKEVAYD